MKIIERSIIIDDISEVPSLPRRIRDMYNELMIRFVVERTSCKLHCSINTIQGLSSWKYSAISNFDINRQLRNDDKFRVALVIPTGLGASLGGHAGDGGSAARLLASLCDKLITHPNVVNASDINEMTENTLYVEGYAMTEYLLGNIGLQEVRQNRVLVIVDGSADPTYVTAAINAVNAARATYGLNCPEVVVLKNPFTMHTGWSSEGCAAGTVDNLDELFSVLDDRKGQYDAIALTSLIKIPDYNRDHYYKFAGVNPWGGVEAMLTHTLSHCFRVPCAHAPMMESKEVEQLDFGVVDPRLAAEAISLTYFPCVLKGLNKAPKLVAESPDVSCLVIPRRCLGIPMFAADRRRISIIAIDDGMKMDKVNCTEHVNALVVNNYLEAAGAVAALRAGVSFESLRRPLEKVKVS